MMRESLGTQGVVQSVRNVIYRTSRPQSQADGRRRPEQCDRCDWLGPVSGTIDAVADKPTMFMLVASSSEIYDRDCRCRSTGLPSTRRARSGGVGFDLVQLPYVDRRT